MAFNVKNINPLDRQPRKAIGVDLPFSGDGVFNSTFQTKDAFFPTIIPTKVEVFSDPDTNLISFFLRYAIANQNIEDEILINIE